jgi:plastocyanin
MVYKSMFELLKSSPWLKLVGIVVALGVTFGLLWFFGLKPSQAPESAPSPALLVITPSPEITPTPTPSPKAARKPSPSPKPTPTPTPLISGPTRVPETVRVVIRDYAFEPTPVTIHRNNTIQWVNLGKADHIVATDPHPAHTQLPGFVSPTLKHGDTYTFQFTKSGTFTYHCHIYPFMKGTVNVLAD